MATSFCIIGTTVLFLIINMYLTYVFVAADYEPTVTFEALYPSGLKVSLPADPGVSFFAFHGKVNVPITQLEPGDLNKDVTKPENGYFTYFNPNLTLKVGDKVNYWIFVRHGDYGYRRDEKSWEVTELVKTNKLPQPCGNPSKSVVKFQQFYAENTGVCKEETILDYKFVEDKISENFWTIEQYIADKPDYEFIVYKKDPDVVFVAGNLLHIRPKVAESTTDLITTLNVSNGCTKKLLHECVRHFGGIYQPPVTSARLVSKVAFAFGKVEVRAKLPIGDWLYSEFYLEDINNSERKILIASSRGNRMLKTENGEDISNKVLRCGMVIDSIDTDKNKYTSSYGFSQGLGNEMHKFTVVWKNDYIGFYVDDQEYCSMLDATLKATGFNQPNLMKIVIGVGAGGINAFPDNCVSGLHKKPWTGRERNMVKKFFDDKSSWLSTWNPEISQLQVEYVKVVAL